MNFDSLRDWATLIVVGLGIAAVVRSTFLKDILGASVRIIFRRKYLWLFGFFAGLVAYGGEPDLLFRDSNSFSYIKDLLSATRDAFRGSQGELFLKTSKAFLHDYPWTVIGSIVVGLVLLLALLWLILVSQTALIYISGRMQQKKTASLFDGIGIGAQKFKSTVSITIIMKLFAWAVWLIMTGAPALYFFMYGKPLAATIASIGALLVSLPISIILSFLTKYAITYVTLQNVDPITALRNAWNLFRKNWVLSIEMAIVVFALNTVALVLFTGATVVTFQTITGWGELITLIAVLIVLQGVVYAFSYTAWTTAFLRMVEGKTESKFGQWSTRLVDLVQSKQPNS